MLFASRLLPTRSDLIRSNDDYFHVYNRGVDRQVIFFSAEYYELFLSLVGQAIQLNELKILAYCLMPNHFHFLVRQTREFGLSFFMEHVCGEYAKTVNQMRERKGHLFQGRYKLKWIHTPATLPIVANYIHLNPVLSGLVKSPADWEYGSCRDYLGLRDLTFVAPGDILANMTGFETYERYLANENPDSHLPRHLRFRE